MRCGERLWDWGKALSILHSHLISFCLLYVAQLSGAASVYSKNRVHFRDYSLHIGSIITFDENWSKKGWNTWNEFATRTFQTAQGGNFHLLILLLQYWTCPSLRYWERFSITTRGTKHRRKTNSYLSRENVTSLDTSG